MPEKIRRLKRRLRYLGHCEALVTGVSFLMKRLAIQVSGRVQGVFFRHSARMRAEKLGLAGWIRNEEDGSVAVVAEGEERALEKFIEWCRKGPPLASVENISVIRQDATGEFKKFEIL